MMRVTEWGEEIIKSLGPEFRDLFFKPQDLIKTGDEQKDFLKDIYAEGFRDAFQVLEDHLDHFIDHVIPITQKDKPDALEAVRVLREALERNLNYLHFKADDLSGDDCIGDSKLTATYQRRIKETESALLATERFGGE